MKVATARTLEGLPARFFSGFFGAGLFFAFSPILLLLAGSSPEADAYTNTELGFSLLGLAGTSGCVFVTVSNIYKLVDAPLRITSLFVRLPAQPEATPEESPDERERVLPVVAPSLVLPTLISGLGGWVAFATRAPRVEARHSAA